MAKKKTIEEEINGFLELWDCKQQIAFLRDIIPLFELYDVEDEDDWVEKEIGGDKENVRTIRLVRSVYLISKMCEFHAGRFCRINMEYKNLWKRMEKQGLENGQENKEITERDKEPSQG